MKPNLKCHLLGIVSMFALFVVSNGRTLLSTNNQMIKAVNLGGWLVTEGWFKPSLFDSIPNKDFLDGTKLRFKSKTIGKFLSAELGGGTNIVANRASDSSWETFRLWRISDTSFRMRVHNKQFLGFDSTGVNLVAISYDPKTSGLFEIVRNPNDLTSVRIKAPNGMFLQAKTEDLVTADSEEDGQSWRDDDPSVFEMTIVKTLQGEYQVTNGYGALKAPQIMNDHWSTFIVESDFSFIASSGLNAVRIPVGWWTASDPTPAPYVAGSLQYLDNAFSWAENNNLKVILDLHAAPGSQNGMEHSSSRDGFIEWGTDETIQETTRVIEFFTARYANSPSLYAVELINEPLASGVSITNLTNYYEAGYNVVRKHAPNAFVVLSNRIRTGDPKEFFHVASGKTNVVIDVHYYNLYSNNFKSMTVEKNIDYVRKDRFNELQAITTTNGPLTFVGEWVSEWEVQGATQEEYQRFSKAQLEVYGGASFGWAYWSLKHMYDHWNMEWMIKNGYINL